VKRGTTVFLPADVTNVFRRLAVVAAAMAFLVAPASTVRAADAPALVTIRIADPGQDVDAAAFYAQDLGIFRKYGINAEFTLILKGSGAAVAAAVMGGAADIGGSDLTSIANAHIRGLPITVLAPAAIIRASAPTTQMIVAKNSPIQNAKDLEGKTLGLLSLTGASRVATNAWLEASGVALDKVTFVELPASSMAAAVERGTVAGAIINEPSLTASQGCCRVVGNIFGGLGKEWLLSSWYTTSDWLAKNPAVAKNFVSAMREAAIWGSNPRNHQKSGEILNSHTAFPPEILTRMTRATYPIAYDRRTMQLLLDAAYKYKMLTQPVRLADLLAPVAVVQ
jgi:NitT/TauT family transport system substrate-binding protein